MKSKKSFYVFNEYFWIALFSDHDGWFKLYCFWCRGNGSDDGFDSDECEFSDDDFGSDDREKMFMDEETKSRFTNYSMSSSVIKRNDGLTLLDDRFEKVCDYI